MGLFDFLFGKKKQNEPAPQPKQNMQSKPNPAPAPNPQPKPAAPKPAAKPTFTAESFLKHLEALADKYYKERGVVSLEDWMVTQKIGNDFKFYITQYPDEEFNDPNCEVTLMVEFMDHNGRMEVVNKFFPKKEVAEKPAASSNPKPKAPAMPENILGKYYSLEQLRQIPMGQVYLQPIDAGLVFDPSAQQLVQVMAQTSPNIKKFLPHLDLSSTESIAKFFTQFTQKTELGYEFGYSIKMGDAGFVGFIFVQTPAMNEKAINFPHWSIDFCLFQPFEGHGIMTQSIVRVLHVLKSQMNVDEVFAYVDEDNTKSINLLNRLPFDLRPETLTDPATGHKAKLFCCPLHTINFQRR